MSKLNITSLRKLTILVTNDDGIRAPGLRVMEKIARMFSEDVWVVAPENEKSGASHSLTLSEPLRLRKINKKKFAVNGTPTDCVMMALNHLMNDNLPALLLSGVNRGANMGEDVTYSGTVAAAIEGTLLGIPSIALSQSYVNRKVMRWKTSEQHAPKIVRRLIEIGWPKKVLININFPDVEPTQVAGIEVCRQGNRDLSNLLIDKRVDAREQPYYWLGFRREKGNPKQGTDLAAVESGKVAITPLQLDFTDNKTLKSLRNSFK